MSNQHTTNKGHITKDEALLMFHFWYQSGQRKTAVAKKFKRSPDAITRMQVKYEWDRKAVEMQEAESKALMKAQAKDVESDWMVVNSAIKKVAEQLMAKDSTIMARYSDLVQLIRVKLEMTDDLDTQGTGDSSTTVNHINNYFTSLSPEELDEHDNDLGAIFADRSTHSRL